MRVGLITFHSLIKPGGVKRHVFGLKEEFKKRGVYAKIIAPRREKSENYGDDVILLGTSFPVMIGGTQADLVVNFNPPAIEKLFKKEKFDVIHFHNFILPSAWQILEKSRSVNVLTLHADTEGSKLLNFSGLLYFWRQIINWKINGLIGVAPLNLNGFEKFKGPKAVIPNGIDLDEFNPRAKKIKKFLDGKINLLFVGRFEERKGLIYLLKAYQILEKEFKNIRLLVVGAGPEGAECEKFARERDLREVYFEGEKTDRELVHYYNTADIFVSPAIFGESFGIILLEAMACQKPVVAFANEGYRELLEGKRGGILVKNKNENNLAEKIGELIRNKKLRKKVGDWGLKEVKEYSWPNVAGRVLDFYRLCSKSKSGNSNKKQGLT